MPKITIDSGALRLDSKGNKTTITVHGGDRPLRAEAHSFAGRGKAAKNFTVLVLEFEDSEKIVLYLSAEHLTQVAKAIETVAGSREPAPRKNLVGPPPAPPAPARSDK